MRAARTFILGLTLAVAASSGTAEETPILGDAVRTHPEVASHGMVVSRHRLASDVGAEILTQGGNAVDAAVATAFALAVVLPSAGNLGGGGFMLVYDAKDGKTTAIDYREVAPKAASETMFLDASGNVDRTMAGYSRASSGVPGTVAGLWLAHQKFGRLPWSEVMAPAIRLAREGFPITLNLVNNLNAKKAHLLRTPGGQKFFKEGGAPYTPGETFRQPDLARTLELVAEEGPAVFYEGAIADLIVAEMARGGGLITRDDLAAYRAVEREPLSGTYRGYEVVAMPPPSSGGVHVIEMLNILENFDLAAMGAGSAAAFSKMAEAMKYAYADRSRHLGDPGFYDVPVDWLTSKAYAKEIAGKIASAGVTPSAEIAPGAAPLPDSPDTTHISVVDGEGNAVSNTFTLNYSFGSSIVVEGAGFLLNDEMDDFSAKPGAANAYGLLGDQANAIAAGKRPLSSMTPVIVLKDGKPAYVLGAPGGSMIITAVLQAIVNLVEFKMPLADAIQFDRIHHQWQPDVLLLDPYFNAEARKALEAMGYKTKTPSFLPVVEGIEVGADGWLYGFADLRRADGGATGSCRENEVVAC
jgi:gamma-glutamyltranspeptidase / glutathione hydrolase